jgi:hypothetical protein
MFFVAQRAYPMLNIFDARRCLSVLRLCILIAFTVLVVTDAAAQNASLIVHNVVTRQLDATPGISDVMLRDQVRK